MTKRWFQVTKVLHVTKSLLFSSPRYGTRNSVARGINRNQGTRTRAGGPHIIVRFDWSCAARAQMTDGLVDDDDDDEDDDTTPSNPSDPRSGGATRIPLNMALMLM